MPFAPGALAPVRFMLSGPSSLNRPHPPHSRAHRDFTAKRLIRDAFAVRERRGGPRVVPSFHYHSFLACRPLRPRGARSSLCPVPRCRHGPSPRVERLGAPKYPAIRFTRELVFVAFSSHLREERGGNGGGRFWFPGPRFFFFSPPAPRGGAIFCKDFFFFFLCPGNIGGKGKKGGGGRVPSGAGPERKLF